MDIKRVVVVGASTSGVLAALLLAQDGHDVTLVDESSTPGKEQRSLIVTDRLLSMIEPDLTAGCIRARVDRFELHAADRSATVELARPDLIIERSVLISDLLEAAVAAGVTVLPGHRFAGFSEALGVRLIGPSGSRDIDAEVVVGADGCSSAVAACLGIRHARLSLLQAIAERSSDLPANTSRVWFKPAATPYFFWLIPDEGSHVAVGLIARSPAAAKPALDAFLTEQGIEPLSFQAARVPDYRHVPIQHRVDKRDVYLVGDAAAQVKVSTVGGVVTGLRGAIITAAMISGHEATLERAGLRSELALHAMVRRALNGLDEATYARLLMELSEPARRRLGASSRDTAFPMLVRALSRSPRVGLIGIRGLLAAWTGSPA